MSLIFSASVRRLGLVSAASYTLLSVAYAVTLIIGFLSLESPDDPIGDPMFTILEVLILIIVVSGVSMFGALVSWAVPEKKLFGVMALVFMCLLAVVTSSVHFVILTVSRHPAFAEASWRSLLLSFRWPSVVYALDILAWDLFFPLAALFAAMVFEKEGPQRKIRMLLTISALLSFAGLAGVFLDDMLVRNIGIIGYAVIFPVATGMMARVFSEAGASA